MRKSIKLILIIMFVFSTSILFAQKQEEYKAPNMPINKETTLISYNGEIEMQGTKDLLFRKGITWYHSYIKNSKNFLKEENVLEGKFVARPRFKIMSPPPKKGIQTMAGVVNYTLIMTFKEGKYSYEITDMKLQQASDYPIENWMKKDSKSYQESWEYYLMEVDKNIQELISDMKKRMAYKQESK